MLVEINDSLMKDVNEILEEYDMPIERFVWQAAVNYINLCRRIQEREVTKTEEPHTYKVSRKEELTGLRNALRDNGIPYQNRPTGELFTTEITTYVNEEDFAYLLSVASNHRIYFPVKVQPDWD